MYKLKLHKTLTEEKWKKYPKAQQLLMVANELNRLINGQKAGQNLSELQACMERIFELFDLTVACQKGYLQKELLRWRELFAANYLLNGKQLHSQKATIKKLYRAFLYLNSTTAELIYS